MTRKERALKNLKQMCSDGRYLGSGSYAPLEVLEDFEVALKALEQEPRWIPVSERLPESNGNYLITYCHRNVIETQEADYVEDEEEAKWYDTTGIEITLAVTAWMPLPKAYREVEE